ncbi:MAG: hypothetical protein ACRDZN_04945 [Acidimicrobiales bacterium]
MGVHRAWSGAAAAVLIVGAAGGCSSDESTCDAVDSVENATEQLREIDIADERAAGLNGALLHLDRSVGDLTDADEGLSDDVTDLKAEIEDLLRALGPSAEGETDAALTVAAVVPQLNAVLESADALVEDASREC